LKSGRTGTLTARTILRLIKNSEKLRTTFGIALAPDEPINLIKVLERINEIFKAQGKLTASQAEALREVFATRGLVTPQLLLAEGAFEDLTKAIDDFIERGEGIAERLREIRELTTTAQLARFKNNIAVLANEFVTASLGGQSFAKVLKDINDDVAKSRDSFREAGSRVRTYIEAITALRRALQDIPDFQNTFNKSQEQFNRQFLTTAPVLSQLIIGFKVFNRGFEAIVNRFGKSIGQIRAEATIVENMAKRRKEVVDKLVSDRDKLAELRDRDLKIEGQDLTLSAEIKILQALETSELEILRAKERQLLATKNLETDEKALLELAKNRLDQQVALIKERQKEFQLASGLIQRFVQADEMEKEGLKRVIELVQLRPDELAKRYKKDMFDRKLIDDFFGDFSKKGQRAINELRIEEFDLPIEIPEEIQATELANQFGTAWEKSMLRAVGKFEIALLNAIETGLAKLAGRKPELIKPTASGETVGALPTITAPRRGEPGTFPLGERVFETRVGAGGALSGRELTARRKPETLQTIVTVGDITVRAEGTSPEVLAEAIKKAVDTSLKSNDTLDKINRNILKR
jgi:hypothetical protein